jgi:hypothetical protein
LRADEICSRSIVISRGGPTWTSASDLHCIDLAKQMQEVATLARRFNPVLLVRIAHSAGGISARPRLRAVRIQNTLLTSLLIPGTTLNTTTKTTTTAKTLTRERRSPRAQGVSPVFRTALRSVCADQGAFHSHCATLQALGDPPPLALATHAGVGLGQGVVV